MEKRAEGFGDFGLGYSFTAGVAVVGMFFASCRLDVHCESLAIVPLLSGLAPRQLASLDIRGDILASPKPIDKTRRPATGDRTEMSIYFPVLMLHHSIAVQLLEDIKVLCRTKSGTLAQTTMVGGP